ncbi:YesL family protein [Metabacillus niabensis]|uniref:YesL family protein n=1 Tax=Metabacillus niabensis TaxID=324854 RepID=UPI001CFAA80B|nr:DUF624 domain-containing protein [Metabacillus niabensis]
MHVSGISAAFYKISEVFVRLAYLNALWIVASLTGLIVFGFFPATIAMFAVIRRWIGGEVDLPVFKLFWKYYKSDFIKGNLLGLILLLFGVTLYVNMKFVFSITASEIFYVPILAITICFSIMLLYIFPVFVHYEINLLQVIKNSFLIMVLNPKSTIGMAIGIILLYIIGSFIPSLILFLGGSSLALLMMWSAKNAFVKVVQKE